MDEHRSVFFAKPESTSLDRAVANELACLVRKLELHAPLDDDDRQALLALPTRIQELKRGSVIGREGRRGDHYTVLLSGLAYRQKVSRNGKRQITAVLIPGEMIDLETMFLGDLDHNVHMLTAGKVASIPRSDFQAAFEGSSRIARAIAAKLASEGAMFREWKVNVGGRDARSRIAHLFCELAVRLNGQGQFVQPYELPMSQEQLADSTGLTPVHVNRTLRQLERDGLIARNHRTIAFPDWKALREVAEFDDRYLSYRQDVVREDS